MTLRASAEVSLKTSSMPAGAKAVQRVHPKWSNSVATELPLMSFYAFCYCSYSTKPDILHQRIQHQPAWRNSCTSAVQNAAQQGKMPSAGCPCAVKQNGMMCYFYNPATKCTREFEKIEYLRDHLNISAADANTPVNSTLQLCPERAP